MAEELRDYQKSIEFNPVRLEEIEERLVEINGLKRKYGNDIATILEYRESIGSELEALSMGEESMDTLKAEIQTQQKATGETGDRAGKKTGTGRRETEEGCGERTPGLEHEACAVRHELCNYEPDPEGFTTYKNKKVKTHANGIGEIEFLFSPNPGRGVEATGQDRIRR